MSSLWERLEHSDAAARPVLSGHTLAVTALGIADAEGLEAITMRRLATDLGVTPMAAYRHVSGKGDLFELMVDLVYSEVELPHGDGWRETLRALACGLRAL